MNQVTTECDLEENFISTGKNNGKNIFGFRTSIVYWWIGYVV